MDSWKRRCGVQLSICISSLFVSLGVCRYGCLEKLAAKEVDVAGASGEDVFLARELYDLQLQLLAETRDADRANGRSHSRDCSIFLLFSLFSVVVDVVFLLFYSHIRSVLLFTFFI